MGNYMTDPWQQISRHITSKITLNGTPFILGINGVDTSGKTRLARDLAGYLRQAGYRTQLIHIDDFHNPAAIRNKHPDPVTTYLRHTFNLKLLEQEILAELTAGKRIDKTITLLDLLKNRFTVKKRYIIDTQTVVIIEGVLLYREPLDAYFNLRVFLDIKFDEVLQRARQRDVPLYGPEILARYQTKYIPAQQRYLAQSKPKERCDLLIDNNDFHNPRLITRLEKKE